MIALLVVSLGALACAHLYFWGQRFGQDSAAGSQASAIAAEIIERIRVSGVPSSSTAADSFAGAPASDAACDPHAVNPRNDRNCFFASIAERLPVGVGAIDADSPSGYRVTIAWQDRASTADPGDCDGPYRLWYDGTRPDLFPAGDPPAEPLCLRRRQWVIVQ